MNRNILFLVISVLFCVHVSGQTFNKEFTSAIGAKNMAKAEEILKKWDFADSNDAELYVAYFNFYTVKSQEAVGLVSTTKYDNNYSKKALEYISEGIERFPTRFDMRAAKIYMLANLKEFSTLTSEVIKTIEYSVKIKNDWKGAEFRIMDEPVEMFYGAIVEFQGLIYKEKNEALYSNMLKISEAMIKHYPKNVQSMLEISTVYVRQKKYNESIEILQKALKIEPKNTILNYNLAYVYEMKAEKANAKKYFEFVVANATEKEDQLKEAAQRHLNELK